MDDHDVHIIRISNIIARSSVIIKLYCIKYTQGVIYFFFFI